MQRHGLSVAVRRHPAVVNSLPPFGLQVLNWVTRLGGKCSFLLSHLSGPSLALWQTFCLSFRKLSSNLLRDCTESPAAHRCSKRWPLLLMEATCAVLRSQSIDWCSSVRATPPGLSLLPPSPVTTESPFMDYVREFHILRTRDGPSCSYFVH